MHTETPAIFKPLKTARAFDDSHRCWSRCKNTIWRCLSWYSYHMIFPNTLITWLLKPSSRYLKCSPRLSMAGTSANFVGFIFRIDYLNSLIFVSLFHSLCHSFLPPKCQPKMEISPLLPLQSASWLKVVKSKSILLYQQYSWGSHDHKDKHPQTVSE